MARAKSPVPEGFHTVTPHLVVKGAAKAIDFYREAFGAQEVYRNAMPDGETIMHAQVKIGDSFVMLNDEFPEHGAFGPSESAASPVAIHLYVEDVDAFYEQAVAAGCEVLFPLTDSFWGDRYGMVKDPFHHRWSIATRVEDLTPEECAERAQAAFSSEVGP